MVTRCRVIEIRRAADRLARVLCGRTPKNVELLLPGLEGHIEKLRGRRIESVQSRAKALLIHFAGGHSLYSHNQLYGRWYVVRNGTTPKTGRSLRLAIHIRDHSALLYSASDIAVFRTAQLRTHPYLCKLGPDLLDPHTKLSDVCARVEDPRFHRRSLASLLLDQGFLAGPGNYLRSEILYVAGLRHDLTLGSIDGAARLRLAEAALATTAQAYRCRGVTNDLERAARLKAEGLRHAQYRHHVFARAGLGCWTCHTAVQRVNVSGRAIFFCPNCQSNGPAGAATGRGRWLR